MYSYGQIALATAHAITGHTHTSKSTDYYPNCTRKCVINYTKIAHKLTHFFRGDGDGGINVPTQLK